MATPVVPDCRHSFQKWITLLVLRTKKPKINKGLRPKQQSSVSLYIKATEQNLTKAVMAQKSAVKCAQHPSQNGDEDWPEPQQEVFVEMEELEFISPTQADHGDGDDPHDFHDAGKCAQWHEKAHWSHHWIATSRWIGREITQRIFPRGMPASACSRLSVVSCVAFTRSITARPSIPWSEQYCPNAPSIMKFVPSHWSHGVEEDVETTAYGEKFVRKLSYINLEGFFSLRKHFAEETDASVLLGFKGSGTHPESLVRPRI
jgi:hypothetical protein